MRQRITDAAIAAGRDPASVTLIGVAKSQSVERIGAALDAGLADLGENYLQEARAHFGALAGRSFGRHFIGALQTNKTREAAALFDWVHALDRLRIAERLSAQRPDSLPALSVCIQVQLGDEATKSGVATSGLPALADAIAALPRLRLRGLMGLPPAESDPARQRRWFRLPACRAAECCRTSARRPLDGYERRFCGRDRRGRDACRIGTAIFGERV